MKTMIRSIVKGIAVIALLFASWRIVTLGLAEHYVTAALEGDGAAVEKALSWNAKEPKALYLKANTLKESDPAQAEQLLRESLFQNPADARPMILLAQLLQQRGDVDKADALVEQATALMPALQWVQLEAANHWVNRDRVDKAIKRWSAALTTQPALGRQIFPLLLKIAEQPQGLPLLKPLAQKPPAWWDQFFSYLASEAQNLPTLVAVAVMRERSEEPFSTHERNVLARRLKKEQQWPEAYLVWINGLTPEQQRHLGGIYNGGFELPISNEGFDWHHPVKMQGVDIRRQHSFGIAGEKALHLIFKGREFRFNQLYQPLFLSPGKYEFRVNVRTDQLKGRGGLKWTLSCADKNATLLGETYKFIGTSEWETVRIGFPVPANDTCHGQILRLESTGNSAYDHKLEGDIWFDQMIIKGIR